MKPVVLVGKGPSAQSVPASDAYVIAAVNDATRFCERVDFVLEHLNVVMPLPTANLI